MRDYATIRNRYLSLAALEGRMDAAIDQAVARDVWPVSLQVAGEPGIVDEVVNEIVRRYRMNGWAISYNDGRIRIEHPGAPLNDVEDIFTTFGDLFGDFFARRNH